MKIKSTVLYHSVTGNTKQMAETIAEAMQTVEGVESKCFSIEEVDEAWLKESKCIILGTPIYYGSVSGEIKSFMDGPFRKYGVDGKIGGAFATANFISGGGELGIRLIFDHMLCAGMLVYSGRFGSLGPIKINSLSSVIEESIYKEKTTDIFKHYGQRMAIRTIEIFNSKRPE